MGRRRTLRQIDKDLADCAARRFVLLDHLTRDLEREIRECDDEINRLLDERSLMLTGGSDAYDTSGEC